MFSLVVSWDVFESFCVWFSLRKIDSMCAIVNVKQVGSFVHCLSFKHVFPSKKTTAKPYGNLAQLTSFMYKLLSE